MKILVQKFGGTSVSTKERRKNVIDKIIKAKESGYFPVVVVSAMGRSGEPYATDTFLSMVDSNFKNANRQGIDLLISCGEIISSVVMCNELYSHGVQAVPITGGQAGIITDSNFNNAEIVRVETKNILKIIRENKVPIIAGFQGENEEGFTTTLGRGGSDVTAAVIGAALKACEVEIYTDVDGIMTADPRIVSDAKLITQISYNEIFQFADQGAKVIHPRAVEIAMKWNIPLVVKNTMNDCSGTIINSDGSKAANTIITGITSMDNRVQIKVKSNDINHDILFDNLANSNISLDLINVFPKETIFTIDMDNLSKSETVATMMEIEYATLKNCTKIAIIGSRMRGIPGVMAKILKALTKEKIEVLQTADSHTTIWCLVESKLKNAAINALHKEFNLDKV